MKGEELFERLLDFAVRIIRLVQALPKTPVGKQVGGQLLRCGTSAGSNYEEARGAESLADFIHKLAVSWKEMRETCFWLKLAQRAELLKPRLLESIVREGNELSAILSQSLATARKSKH
jgi:four helix bundle protein